MKTLLEFAEEVTGTTNRLRNIILLVVVFTITALTASIAVLYALKNGI